MLSQINSQQEGLMVYKELTSFIKSSTTVIGFKRQAHVMSVGNNEIELMLSP